MTSVQSLDTMEELKEMNGYVPTTIDKLPGIRADLVRIDDDWHNWDFGQFVEQLRQWNERNPIRFEKKPPEHQKRNSVTSINGSRKILSDEKFCFNCTRTKDRVNEYKSENTCRTC